MGNKSGVPGKSLLFGLLVKTLLISYSHLKPTLLLYILQVKSIFPMKGVHRGVAACVTSIVDSAHATRPSKVVLMQSPDMCACVCVCVCVCVSMAPPSGVLV